MSGFNVYPQPVAASRMVLKQNTAGQIMLPTLGSPITATTSSSNDTFGSWAQVTASTTVEYYITGALAFCTNSSSLGVNAPLYVGIGTGAAGSEVSLSIVPIGSSVGMYGSPSSFAPGGHALLDAPARVTAGSRVAVRAALSGTNGGAQSCKVYLIVVPYSAVEGN